MNHPAVRRSPAHSIDPIVRMTDVISFVGLSKSKIYELIAEDLFPRPLSLLPNGRAKGWRLSAIKQWLDARETASTEVLA
jgi:predicted DNA-binding transcriptional regulator AlpA